MNRYIQPSKTDRATTSRRVGSGLAAKVDDGAKESSVDAILKADEEKQIRRDVDPDEDLRLALDDDAAEEEDDDELEQEEEVDEEARANER